MRKRKSEIAEEWEKKYKRDDECANHEAYAYTMAYDFLIDMIDELKHDNNGDEANDATNDLYTISSSSSFW